ncbi:MAG: sulfotransferase [Rhizomicrobium sp.]
MNDAERSLAARRRYETAVALHRQERLAEAERHYRDLHRTYPAHPGVLHGLGLICLRTDRLEEAADFLQRASAAAPQDDAIPTDLGKTYLMLGRYDDARRHFQAVLARHPGQAAALIGLGDALGVLGRPAEALAAFERLLAVDPNNAAAHFGIGTVKTQLGAFAEARHAFEAAVALAPRRPVYHRALAEAGRFGAGDPRLPALEEMARDIGGFPDDQKVELHFALAKAYDDLQRYDDAFAHWQKGNALKRRSIAYDEAAVARFFGDAAAAFTPALMETKRETGHPSELPIFVVGMPRSGTSLVEQILASHPAVFGGGELLYVNELLAGGHAGADYPSGIATLPNTAFQRFGHLYAERLGALAPDAGRIVDKLPANFRHLGLLHLALPKARIIHVRRDPLDTCFSCYSKLFLNGLNFAYDLGELGRYYKGYEALMAHWHAVLPESVLLDVQYETLVENLESEARRIVAFCGRDWDARCLAFHETSRAVRTHSQAQVRQPVFKDSIGRWRPYGKWLQPLRDALA